MPTITLSKKELLKTLGKKLSDEALSERISMLGTDLEGIEGDEIFVEIFPNRPDLLSQQGFARALSSFLGINTGLQEYKVTPSGVDVIVEKSAENCRPYTACAVIDKLKITDEKLREIIMIQEKLHVTYGRNRKKVAIGIYPMEQVTAPITFKGIAPKELSFVPLEATKEMSAQEILEEHPKGKEFAHLVQNLKQYACFVDAKNEIMSLTPIINSNLAGRVSESTTKVFVECSGFDFAVISKCLNMIVTALGDMGGSIHSCKLTYKHGKLGTIVTPQLEATTRPIHLDYVNKILGVQFSEKDLKTNLEKMGFAYSKGKVSVPSYRADILHEVDFIEDIAIAHGYENFKPQIPQTSTVGQEAWLSIIERKVREILIGHGLLEMKNYHLVNKELQEHIETKNVLTLKNSVSKEFDTMRSSPIVSVLSAFTRNKHHEYPQRVFEIGTGFVKTAKGHEEKRYAVIALAGEKEDYTSARQILDSVLQAMDKQATVRASKTSWLLEGRQGEIIASKSIVGHIGEVHPQTLTSFSLEMPCSCVVLDLDLFL